MTPRAATATTNRNVLAFRRREHWFAIDASCVAFVHDRSSAEGGFPRVDLRAVVGDDVADDTLHDLRVVVGDASFDVRAGTNLRVVRLEDRALSPIPMWLERFALRAALGFVTITDDDAIWLLDPAALSRCAQSPAGERA